MIAVGNENKKVKTKTDGIIVIIWLCYHCWGVIIVYPYFILLNILFGLLRQKIINEFTVVYIINPGLNVTKSFRQQVQKCMCTKFGEITQPFIKGTLLKNNTRALALIMFHETIADKKAYGVLSCVVGTIIKNYVCIDYLSCQFFSKVK